MHMYNVYTQLTYIVHVHCSDGFHLTYMYMINILTLVNNKAKTYKSNPKAATFQRKIAASGGT